MRFLSSFPMTLMPVQLTSESDDAPPMEERINPDWYPCLRYWIAGVRFYTRQTPGRRGADTSIEYNISCE